MSVKNESCSSCNEKDNCNGEECTTLRLAPNDATEVKNMVAVMSGKGGVGKSSISALLAVNLARRGLKVGVLDADITGPSIPKMFNLKEQPHSDGSFMYPLETPTGIRVISMNLLLPSEDQPVIWRGPVISGAVKQFWTDVAWGKLDYLVIDMPPGTGDVPLTVMQSLPLTGFIIVTSPQYLASIIVKKALNMANHMNVPILGMVENYSYLKCPDCGTDIKLFGEGSGSRLARETGIPLLEKLPVDPQLAALCDKGQIESYAPELFSSFPALKQ